MTNRFSWHKYCGYAVLLLATFRVAWGFVGTRYARFDEFLCSPRHTAQYWRQLRANAAPTHHIGHNPLGAWSVIMMLVLLLTQAGTGLFANDEVSKVGPFFGWASNSLSNTFTQLHHLIFTLLQGMIFLHILAIGYYGYVRKVDLLIPMITGRKSAILVADSRAIRSSRVLLALFIVTMLITLLAAALTYAPKTSLSIF